MHGLALSNSIRGLTLLLLGVAFAQHAFPQTVPVPNADQAADQAAARRPLRMLALGDSVMWGQGLKNENKFSYKLRDWLCELRGDAQCRNGSVQLHVEAHSGAVISKPDDKRKEEEEARFKRASYPVRYEGEVNNAFPTLWGQLELAERYYRNQSVPAGEVDFILINGCINDISGAKLLVHRLIGGDLKTMTERYCFNQMKEFLPKVAEAFPNARIVVPGYFPLVSEGTPPFILFETLKEWLFGGRKSKTREFEAFEEDWEETPDKDTSRQTEKTTRTMRRLAERSREFVTRSNDYLKKAVEELNRARPMPTASANSKTAPPDASARALFVPVPFDRENAYAASNSFLWRLGRKNPSLVLQCVDGNIVNELAVEDEVQDVRPCMCDQAGRRNDLTCVRAGSFHPNRKGAQAYFEAIRQRLEPIIDSTGWAARD